MRLGWAGLGRSCHAVHNPPGAGQHDQHHLGRRGSFATHCQDGRHEGGAGPDEGVHHEAGGGDLQTQEDEQSGG